MFSSSQKKIPYTSLSREIQEFYGKSQSDWDKLSAKNQSDILAKHAKAIALNAAASGAVPRDQKDAVTSEKRQFDFESKDPLIVKMRIAESLKYGTPQPLQSGNLLVPNKPASMRPRNSPPFVPQYLIWKEDGTHGDWYEMGTDTSDRETFRKQVKEQTGEDLYDPPVLPSDKALVQRMEADYQLTGCTFLHAFTDGHTMLCKADNLFCVWDNLNNKLFSISPAFKVEVQLMPNDQFLFCYKGTNTSFGTPHEYTIANLRHAERYKAYKKALLSKSTGLPTMLMLLPPPIINLIVDQVGQEDLSCSYSQEIVRVRK